MAAETKKSCWTLPLLAPHGLLQQRRKWQALPQPCSDKLPFPEPMDKITDKPLQARLSTSLHSITAPCGTGGACTLPGSALFGWTGLGSARLCSAQLCLSLGLTFSLGKEEQNGVASAESWLFLEAIFPAMTGVVWNNELAVSTELRAPPLVTTATKRGQCVSRKHVTEMMESGEMGNAIAAIGKTYPTRSATSGTLILVWFTAYCLF